VEYEARTTLLNMAMETEEDEKTSTKNTWILYTQFYVMHHLKCDHKIKIYVIFFCCAQNYTIAAMLYFFYFYFYQISHFTLTVTLVLSIFFQIVPHLFTSFFEATVPFVGQNPILQWGYRTHSI
jgi:hypothetical protein